MPDDELEALTNMQRLAHILGLSRVTLSGYFAEGCPRTKGSARASYVYDLRAIIEWLRKHKWVDPRNRERPENEDPLLSGEASPALERYRAARAEVAELDLAVKKMELIPRAELHQGLSRIATVLRGAGERLQRDHGEDARAILDDALDDCERDIDTVCRLEEEGPASSAE